MQKSDQQNITVTFSSTVRYFTKLLLKLWQSQDGAKVATMPIFGLIFQNDDNGRTNFENNKTISQNPLTFYYWYTRVKAPTHQR